MLIRLPALAIKSRIVTFSWAKAVVIHDQVVLCEVGVTRSATLFNNVKITFNYKLTLWRSIILSRIIDSKNNHLNSLKGNSLAIETNVKIDQHL